MLSIQRFSQSTLLFFQSPPRFFQSLSLKATSIFVAIAMFTLIAIIAIFLFRHSNVVECKIGCAEREHGAMEAVKLLKDTTTWLASIQTATLAALGLLAKDGVPTFKPTRGQMQLSISVVMLNSAALFFSAWVLTSIPSVMLRVYGSPTSSFDFYNLPIYPIWEKYWIGKIFTVNFFITCNHFLWGIGVLLFGFLCVSMAVSRKELDSQQKTTEIAP